MKIQPRTFILFLAFVENLVITAFSSHDILKTKSRFFIRVPSIRKPVFWQHHVPNFTQILRPAVRLYTASQNTYSVYDCYEFAVGDTATIRAEIIFSARMERC